MALERSSAHMISDIEKMRTKLNKAKFAVQVAKVREKAPKTQAANLNGVGQMKSEAILNAAKVTGAHWQDNAIAEEVTHAVARRTELSKLESSTPNEAVQQ